MGKDRDFTFKEKLEIISHYENLVASRIKISKKAMTEWQILNLVHQFHI